MLRVLLVCTGNICRSPIAHGLLADRSTWLLDGGIAVRSAGTWAREGSPATREAVGAAMELGIDISGHRASPFSRGLATWADLIVTMTIEQAGEVAEIAPDTVSKTFPVKELVRVLEGLPPVSSAPVNRRKVLRRIASADRTRWSSRAATQLARGDPDVADPLGLSQTVYRAIAHELAELIDRLVAGLVGNLELAKKR